MSHLISRTIVESNKPRKIWRIFGRAIPTWLIITLLVVVVAIAAWISVVLTLDVEFYSDDGIADPTLGVPVCTIETDTDGSITSCTATPNGIGFDVAMVGAFTPGDRIYVKFDMQSNHDTDLYIGPVSGAPEFGGDFLYGENKCGATLVAGSPGPVNNFEARWELDPSASTGQTYTLSADFELTESPPTCLYPALP